MNTSPVPIDYATPRRGGLRIPNNLANASLVCALLAVVIPVIPAVVAIILGIKALRKTRDPNVDGKGIAVAALTVGSITFLVGVWFVCFVVAVVNDADETARRIACAANMRHIGAALYQYASENGGKFPPRLEDLLLTQKISTAVFVCPDSSDTPALGSTPKERAAALSSGGHLSYIYIPNLTTSASPEAVLLYEPLGDHGDETHILFADGHVEGNYKTMAAGIVAELKAGFNPPRKGHY
jgi:prepilin-type processing-associated H-X9-DG protein